MFTKRKVVLVRLGAGQDEARQGRFYHEPVLLRQTEGKSNNDVENTHHKCLTAS
jgi:hypothetical protein